MTSEEKNGDPEKKGVIDAEWIDRFRNLAGGMLEALHGMAQMEHPEFAEFYENTNNDKGARLQALQGLHPHNWGDSRFAWS